VPRNLSVRPAYLLMFFSVTLWLSGLGLCYAFCRREPVVALCFGIGISFISSAI